MATSINGYPVLGPRSSYLSTKRVPGTTKSVRLRSDIQPVFLALLSEIDKTVINLDGGPLDGYAYRYSRYVTKWSNHSSGTATDMRYDVLKADHRRHMSSAQRAQMNRLLNKYVINGKKVFTWGGNWSSRAMDEMHLEISRGVTVKDVKALQAKLRIDSNGKFRSTTVVPSTPAPAWPVVNVSDVQPGDVTPDVKIVQKALWRLGYLASSSIPSTTASKFDTATRTAYARWQKHLGYTGTDADGRPGIKSLTLLGNKYGFTVKP